jgi:hypothetical protein
MPTGFTTDATTLSFSIYGSYAGVSVHLMTDANQRTQQVTLTM